MSLVVEDAQSAAGSGDLAPPNRVGHRRRVVMLVNRLRRGGGAERALVAVAANLPRERFDVTVVTTRRETGPLLDSLLAQGVRHVGLDRRSRFDLAPFWRLFRLLRREQVDILHSHMFGSNVWGSVIGRLAGVPLVVAHEHSWSYEGQRVRRFLDGHLIGRLADVFVAVTARDRELMIGLEGVPAEKVVILPNPYVRRPGDPTVDVRRSLGVSRTAPLLCTVCVHRPEKALEVLLRGFAELLEVVPEATLAIAGDGPRRAALEAEARELGLTDRVRFLGWWQDVGALLEAADVAVISSDTEGAPLFAIECMAHMTPLVSTDVGNVGELLGDGEGVVLVPRRDPRALAKAVGALLRDPDRRRQQAAAAAARVEPYRLESVIDELVDLYERSLEHKSKFR